VKRALKDSARAHLFYGGRVQGVGFRYTVESLAMALDLTGWVKNLPDGRVELVCEGPRDKIEALVGQIGESFLGPQIKKTALDWEKPTGEFEDFRVEFSL